MKHDTAHTIRNVSLGVFLQALRYPFLLLGMVVIPRVMGVTVYGQFALFLSVYMLSESLTGLGNVQIFGRFIPEHDENDPARSARFLHGILFYGLLMTALIAIAVAAVVTAVRPGGFPLRWLIPLTCILFLGKTQGTLFSFLYGRNQIGRFSARDLLRSAFNVIFVILLYAAFGLEGAFWGLALNELALALVSAAWTRDHLLHRPQRLPLAEFWPYLAFGLTFYVPILLRGVMQRSGNILISSLSNAPEQVAFFDIGNQFVMIASSFLVMALTNLVPHLSKLHVEQRSESAEDWMRLALLYCGITATLMWATLLLLGRHVIPLCLGQGFAGAYPNAVILGVALAPILVAQTGTNLTILRKQPHVYTAGILCAIVLMLVTCVLLIPRMGAAGASWATVAGYTTLAAVFLFQYKGELWRISKPFLSAIAIGALLTPCYFLSLGFATACFALIGVSLGYIGLLLLLGIVRKEHVHTILTVLMGRKRHA